MSPRGEGLGYVMVAEKLAKKISTELFDDLPVLERKW
jgi:hypothetical protein